MIFHYHFYYSLHFEFDEPKGSWIFLVQRRNMANKIKDTHASWQNLFNRDAITPRLESKTKLSNLHTKKLFAEFTPIW